MIDPAAEFDLTPINGRAHWRASAGCRYFAGHFPGHPVLPAVAIVDGSLEAIRLRTGESPPLHEIVSAKFISPIVPETEVAIHCENVAGGEWHVTWRDPHGAKTYAELRVRL